MEDEIMTLVAEFPNGFIVPAPDDNEEECGDFCVQAEWLANSLKKAFETRNEKQARSLFKCLAHHIGAHIYYAPAGERRWLNR
jgi:hypothetical protein